ncbi:pimeloyl-ACP methyl ester carboxylesterase [Phycicoccus duodecadis]|uniref:Pimeloyl-ACP methyl ester carboxylesterase n=2 Tax=Phycicoccus duodecadis TaxID=173053 RepID=A0A2N3YJA4_9MICO|nr:pimeloyl-ACP methyl ester carboxylesterase [Phycicoccus duodecadis]
MTTHPGPAPTTATLPVEGAVLTYDVRGDLASTTPDRPPLLLIGAPMPATGFATLASHFPDRVVVTYDPRNTGRSTRDEPTAAVTTAEHAADLHALLAALGRGPVDLFGSSGGAVVALGLVARYPDDLRTLVAHEPPAGGLLPDAERLAAVQADILDTYDREGHGPAMARFIAHVMHRGQVPADALGAPAPDPAMFGLSAEDDGRRDDPLMANLRGGGARDGVDVEAVGRAATRVVVGVGAQSGGPTDGEMAARSGYALAAALGVEPVVFPGGHNGFLGGEFGQTGEPDAFAATLRAVLESPVPS